VRPVPEPPSAAVSSGSPEIARGAGAHWDIVGRIQPQALSRDGDLEVMADIVGQDEHPVTLSEVLAALADESRGMYVRNLVVEQWRPELLRLLPSEIAGLNWLNALPPEARPRWTWLMLGVCGTTTATHIDTLYSAAWNLLITGRKRWRFWAPAWSYQQGLIPALPPELAAASAADGYETEQLPGARRVSTCRPLSAGR
jgi:histone arginine demethylase JMJD6